MTNAMDGELVNAFVDHAQRDFGAISGAQLDEGWRRLQQRRSSTAPAPRAWSGRRPVLAWAAGLAAAALLAGLGSLGYRSLSTRPLHYTVEGALVYQGNTIEASPGATSRLRFSDESSIALDTATRLTMGTLDAHGARIGLLDGAIDVFVKPRPDGAWRFTAGPFTVRVTGTAFRLAFTSSLGRMQLRMTSGHVEVSTPSGPTVAVGAGQTIELFATPPTSSLTAAPVVATASRGDRTAAPHERAPFKEARATPDSPRRRPVAPPPVAPPAATPTAEATPTTPSLAWTQWLSQGKFAQVVADAEQRGIDQVMARAGSGDLAALADAARYIKRYPLSRRVLLGMRARFAATDSAHDAAFFLGRLAEATTGDEPALDWYDTYLREAPRGLYAKAAMGRELRLRAAGSPERARRTARQYLERFPQGPEADLAKSLVESHTE